MLRTILLSRWLYLAMRLALAGVLAAAAVPKLLEPGQFAAVIAAYGLVPGQFDRPLAVGLPLFELVLAGALVMGHRLAAVATAFLLAGFMAVLSWGLHLGLDVDCGCFGVGDPKAEAFHGLRSALVRDAWLLAGCGYLAVYRIVKQARASDTSVRAARPS